MMTDLDEIRIKNYTNINFKHYRTFNTKHGIIPKFNIAREAALQNHVNNGNKFTCKLCNRNTNNFNFSCHDMSYTNEKKMWCKECEVWWTHSGFKIMAGLNKPTGFFELIFQ